MTYLSILIADDETLTRLDMKEHLTQEGHVVCAETGNGAAVLDLAKRTSPNIALLDIRMPGLDGIEVASQLKLLGIPTVLMTAYYQTGLINRAEKVGVYGYLNKPIRQSDIIPALQIAYGRWQDLQKLSKEANIYRHKLEIEKKLDIAKGLYAKQLRISERDAHRRILLRSQADSVPVISICEEIIKNSLAR